MAKKRKVIFFIFTGFLVFVVAVGLVHTFAIYAIPKGFGFNPHPWYAQMPWLNTLRRIFHLPTANLEVSIAYAFFWPAYGLALIVLLAILIYRRIKKST